jgi:CubicO group peptidase (beta-lactamase class C family)
LYGALAGDGTVDGRRYLSAHTIAAVRRIETYRPDRTLFYMPMMWHLGYHSMPTGSRTGFGHIGLGGSFGWADPRRGLSVGFVHNRLDLGTFAWDQAASTWLLPLIMRCARGGSRRAAVPDQRAA